MVGGSYSDDTRVFSPNVSQISSITKGPTTTIVTSTAHGLSSGMIVRIKIPTYIDSNIGARGLCGMPQINNYTGQVTVIDTTTFTVKVDSTYFDDFFIPATWPPYIPTRPEVVPIGDNALTTAGAVTNILT